MWKSGKRLLWHRFPLTWLTSPKRCCNLSFALSSNDDDADDDDDDDDDDAISPFLIMPTLGGDDCYALCGPGLNFCCSFIGSFHQQMQRI